MALVIRTSRIHNRGCYTTTPISKGSMVAEYKGPRITVEEGDRRYEGKEITYLFGLEDGKHVIDGRGIARYINHSCQANCTTQEIDGHVWIIALRDIETGEELSYDYMLYDGEGDAPCHCGARRCRGSMYSPQEIRRRRRPAVRAQRRTAKTRKKPPRKAA